MMHEVATKPASYPPAMAPRMRSGSSPDATASGSGASGDSRDRSRAQAKNRKNGLRCCVTWSRIVPRSIGYLPSSASTTERWVTGAATLQLNLAVNARQPSQMGRQYYPNHDSVWTSTDSTAGRSRTMSAHLSPPSADTYTWPPVVPK